MNELIKNGLKLVLSKNRFKKTESFFRIIYSIKYLGKKFKFNVYNFNLSR